MRKHHNKLFYSKHRYKTVFNMPWAGILYPTTDQQLSDVIEGKNKHVRYLNSDWYKTSPDVIKLAKFILEHRKNMNFRIQDKHAIFYSNQELSKKLVELFTEDWKKTIKVDPRYEKLAPDTVVCKRLPHGKYKYQIHLKKDTHKYLKESERQALWDFIERNVDHTLVTGRYVLDYLEGKSPHCYYGYFYIESEKFLTPIYMMAQKGIDKVIKFVKEKNGSNKKTARA
tara:strand:- start:10 stop:690 length:681 start_codon:yes stop_codon:yes gene_type:complete